MVIRSNFIKNSRRIWAAAAASLSIILLVAIPAASADNISIGGPSDCDSNAILQCGAHTTTGLIQKYQNDPYALKVYAAFGLKQLDITTLPANNVAGHVTRDGQVYIDSQSKPVAINAITAGRQNIAGSTAVSSGGITFYKRPPSVSFQQSSLPAFVSMVNGRFRFAVIASCGNPVIGTAVVTPTGVGQGQPVAKPKPQPKPSPTPKTRTTQTQSQSQAQSQSQSQDVTVNQVTENTNTNTETEAAPEQPAPAAPAPVQQVAAAPAAVTSLPNTGPAGLVGLFIASSVGGTLAYRRYIRRRLAAGL